MPLPVRGRPYTARVVDTTGTDAARATGADPLGVPLARSPEARRLAPVLQQAFGYQTERDLLEHYPRRYLTRGELTDLAHAKKGAVVTLTGTVKHLVKKQPRRNLRILEIRVADEGGSGVWSCTWFNQPWHGSRLPVGTLAAFSGKLEWRAGRLTMANPGYEVLRESDDAEGFASEVIAVYPATKEVSSGRLRRVIAALLDRHGRLPDFLPEELRRAHRLVARGEAVETIHRPEDLAAVDRARRRLVYDELFTLQVGLALRRRALAEGERGPPLRADGPLTRQLLESLPFTPTRAQDRAMAEIGEDLARPRPMHRLLQGEVGSGKTLVSLHMLLAAVQSGFQGAIMAPTEVLADQHFINLRALLDGLDRAGRTSEAPTRDGRLFDFAGPRIEVLTASTTGAARERLRAAVAAGEVDILVGTHALLSEGVDFKRLGAVVVDEQHRFGVHQRVRLREKGDSPHVLIMTATPIPRTLALTLYGDLDVSTLDELPPGRHPVATHLVGDDPALRERAYERVREEAAAGHQAYVVCALKDESDKLEVRSAKAEAERLRTEVFPELRVGLVYGDMRIRGEGTVFDARQSGLSDLKLARLIDDFEWVAKARADAFRLVEADPELAAPEHRALRAEVLARLGGDRAEWLSRG